MSVVTRAITLCLFLYTVPCETCTGSNGNEANCVAISKCPSAVKLLKNGGIPKLCGFIGNESMVCCLGKSKEEDIPFPPGCKQTWQKNVWVPPTPLIVGGGGIDSLAREFPHMAALGFDDEDNKTTWGCGGTLITTEYVLTAAHCLHSRNNGPVRYVRLGDLNLRSENDDASPQNFEVIGSTYHPDYRPPSPYHDIALIKLDRPCRITPYVIPACLNTKNVLPEGYYSATGWGQLGYGGELADHLQNMIIKIFNQTDCEKAYSKISKRRLHQGIDEKTQVCAGAPQIDTCPGDSGGPLQLRASRDNTVYGVTSFGVACVISQIPGVYIKVSAYIPWIKSIILK